MVTFLVNALNSNQSFFAKLKLDSLTIAKINTPKNIFFIKDMSYKISQETKWTACMSRWVWLNLSQRFTHARFERSWHIEISSRIHLNFNLSVFSWWYSKDPELVSSAEIFVVLTSIIWFKFLERKKSNWQIKIPYRIKSNITVVLSI